MKRQIKSLQNINHIKLNLRNSSQTRKKQNDNVIVVNFRNPFTQDIPLTNKTLVQKIEESSKDQIEISKHDETTPEVVNNNSIFNQNSFQFSPQIRTDMLHNLPKIASKSRQTTNLQVTSNVSTQDTKNLQMSGYGEMRYKKRVLERCKIINDLEKQDNLSRRSSLECTINLQNIQQTKSFKILPSIQSPLSLRQQISQSPSNTVEFQNKLSQIKKKTSDLRLVLDGFKKIKYEYKKDNQDNSLGNTTPIKQMSQEQFHQIFKKIKQNKNLPSHSKPDFNDISQQQFDEKIDQIKSHLIKINSIIVILNDVKQPVIPKLKVGLFQLKPKQEIGTAESAIVLGDFIKELNQYFGQSDKKLVLQHLFTPNGDLITNFSDINPESVYLIASQLCNFQDIDSRITKKLIIKQFAFIINSQQNQISQVSTTLQTRRVSIDQIHKKAQELIDQQRKELNGSDNDTSFNNTQNQFPKSSVISSKNSKKQSKKYQSKQTPKFLHHQEMEEFDKIIIKQNEQNIKEIQQIQMKNSEIENDIQKNQIRLEDMLDTDKITLQEHSIQFNSPLAELKCEAQKFNEEMAVLKYELEHKLNVVTKRHVDQSIRLIQDQAEEKLKKRFIEEERQTNAQIYKKMLEEKNIKDQGRKLHALIFVIQRYLKKRQKQKNLSPQQSRNSQPLQLFENCKSQQNILPSIQQNRRYLISKWDPNKGNENNNKVLIKSASFINNVNKSIVSGSNEQSPKNKEKNFIEHNINNNLELRKNVFNHFGTSFEKNIPILESRSGFTRAEIINIFARFKALCEMTMKELRMKNKDLNECKGVNYDNFKSGIPELKFHNERFARRIFESCNGDKSNEYLDWDHFLLAIKAIQARNIDQKIDLFFKIIDEDGNGRLSYEEIYEICSSSFESFSPSIEDDEFMKALTEFFVSVIFRAVGKSVDEEIPMQEIKIAIEKNIPDSDLLLMFCNASKN